MPEFNNLPASTRHPFRAASSDKYVSVRPVAASGFSVPPQSADSVLNYLRLVRQQFGLILLSTGAVAVVALVFSLLQTPQYEGHASLEYQGLADSLAAFRDSNNPANGNESAVESYINTQMGILQSDALIGRAVAKSKLDQRREFRSPGLLTRARQALAFGRSESPRDRAVKAVSKDLKTRPQARMLHIWYTSRDPELAAATANALADELILYGVEARQETAKRVRESLTQQLADIKKQIRASESQLAKHADHGELLANEDRQTGPEARLRLFQEELARAQADRIAKKSLHNVAESTQPEWLPQALQEGSLREHQAKLAELRRQSAELSALLKPSHYRVRQVDAQIAALEAELDRERRAIQNRVDNDYRASLDRERQIAAQYAGQSRLVSDLAARSIPLNTVKRELETGRALEAHVAKTLQDVEVAAALPVSALRIVGVATPPTRPYAPNIPLNTLLGVVGGACFGVGLVVFLERSDRSLKAPGEAELILELPELGAIPSARLDGQIGIPGWRGGDSVSRAEMATWLSGGPSMLTESFRNAVTSLLWSTDCSSRSRVVMFTSPGPAEGKTTVVSNLGIALAQIGRRVLLVGGDLRKPRLHRVFEVPHGPGLLDLLTQEEALAETPLDGFVRALPTPNLYLLPSGSAAMKLLDDGLGQVSNILHSSRVAELITELRNEFDLILIDAPPALQFPDARLWGRLSDAVVLVLRSRKTSRDAAVATTRRLLDDGIPVAGTILTDWNPRTDAAYDYAAYCRHYSHGPVAS